MTIEKVWVQTAIGRNVDLVDTSDELDIVNGKVERRLRVPFVIGEAHHVTIRGDLVDNCEKVQICDGDLRDARLTLLNDRLKRDNVAGRGQLEFDLFHDEIPDGIDATFNIRIRYSTEFEGHDRLDCQMTRRGVITSIEWIGDNLPLRLGPDRASYLEASKRYELRFRGRRLGTAGQQFYDGSTSSFVPAAQGVLISTLNSGNPPTWRPGSEAFLLLQTLESESDESFRVQVLSSVSDRSESGQLTFSPSQNDFIGLKSLPFACGVIGDGNRWGHYVYHRYPANGLPNSDQFTQMSSVFVRPREFFQGHEPLPVVVGDRFEVALPSGTMLLSDASGPVLADGQLIVGGSTPAKAYKDATGLDFGDQVSISALTRRGAGRLRRSSRFSNFRIHISRPFKLAENVSSFPPAPSLQRQVYGGGCFTLLWNQDGSERSAELPAKVTLTYEPKEGAIIFGRIEPTSQFRRSTLIPGARDQWVGTFDSKLSVQLGDPATFTIFNLTLHGSWLP